MSVFVPLSETFYLAPLSQPLSGLALDLNDYLIYCGRCTWPNAGSENASAANSSNTVRLAHEVNASKTEPFFPVILICSIFRNGFGTFGTPPA